MQQSSSKALQTPCSEISSPNSHDDNYKHNIDDCEDLNTKIKEINQEKRPPSDKAT